MRGVCVPLALTAVVWCVGPTDVQGSSLTATTTGRHGGRGAERTAGVGSHTATASATVYETRTATLSHTATPTAVRTQTPRSATSTIAGPTGTVSESLTVTHTVSVSGSLTESATETKAPVTPTSTETVPTATESATATQSATRTLPTATATATVSLPTATETPSLTMRTATVTLSATDSIPVTPTATYTLTTTLSGTVSGTLSVTPTASPTATQTPTPSATPTLTYTTTPTRSVTPSATLTASATATPVWMALSSYTLTTVMTAEQLQQGLNLSLLHRLLEADLRRRMGVGFLEVMGLRLEAACYAPVAIPHSSATYVTATQLYSLEAHITRITGGTYAPGTLSPATAQPLPDTAALTAFFRSGLPCTALRNSSNTSSASTPPWGGPPSSGTARLPRQGYGSILSEGLGGSAPFYISCAGAPANSSYPITLPLSCGIAVVYSTVVRVFPPVDSPGAVAERLFEAQNAPLPPEDVSPFREQFPQPAMLRAGATDPPGQTSVPTVFPPGYGTPSPAGSELSFTLWLGIGGIGGVVLLGALLIFRLTKRGKLGRTDSVNLVQDVGGDVGPEVSRRATARQQQHNLAFSDRGSSIARYEAWRSAVGTHMAVGMEEVATPVPIYRSAEHMPHRIRASKGKPDNGAGDDIDLDGMAEESGSVAGGGVGGGGVGGGGGGGGGGSDALPTSPGSPAVEDGSRAIAPAFHYLDQPQSTRYASVIDSYDSNPLHAPVEANAERERERERDRERERGDVARDAEVSLEEHSVAQLVAALKQHGIDLSNAPHATIVKSALHLVHARAHPLQYCCNCIRGANPYFLTCKCKKVCYCDEDCKRRHWWYHKSECK